MCCKYGRPNRTELICLIRKPLFTGLSAMSHRARRAYKPYLQHIRFTDIGRSTGTASAKTRRQRFPNLLLRIGS
jgi:hypothetical protein